MNILRIFINLFRFDPGQLEGGEFVRCLLRWFFGFSMHSIRTILPMFGFHSCLNLMERNMHLREHLPKSVNLNVSGNGWDLFRRHLGVKVPPVIIPLERAKEIKKIVGSTLPPMLATQVGT